MVRKIRIHVLNTDITWMQAPRISRAEVTPKENTLYDADQKGTLIYITDIAGRDNMSQRMNVFQAGYYYSTEIFI